MTREAIANGVVTVLGGLIKLAPELAGILARGMRGADESSPLTPRIRAILPPAEDTELGRLVDELSKG